ncbi:hypothetical protein ABEY96_14130 [Priestia aryabhattai]|uniref:hypothetical protein n=1 Tax=Priestia aryabhattai TaxID=412384 RepID=UPI003D268158
MKKYALRKQAGVIDWCISISLSYVNQLLKHRCKDLFVYEHLTYVSSSEMVPRLDCVIRCIKLILLMIFRRLLIQRLTGFHIMKSKKNMNGERSGF